MDRLCTENIKCSLDIVGVFDEDYTFIIREIPVKENDSEFE